MTGQSFIISNEMSPRTALQNERIRDERREEILRAALRVFARAGFEATKIADIAAAAEMSHGLIYRYFPSKEAAFLELVQRAVRGGMQLTERTLANTQAGTPGQRLHQLLERMLDGVRHNPEYSLIIVQAYASGTIPPEATELLERYSQQTLRALSQLIRDAQASGEVRKGDAREFATLLLAAVQGLSITRLEPHTRTRPMPRAQTLYGLLQP